MIVSRKAVVIGTFIVCIMLFLAWRSQSVAFKLTRFFEKNVDTSLIGEAKARKNRLDPRQRKKFRQHIFNFQILEPEQWIMDDHGGELVINRFLNYATRSVYRSSLKGLFTPREIAGTVEFAHDVEGYDIDRFLPLDPLPRDSWLEICFGEREGTGFALRLSSFPGIRSGLYGGESDRMVFLQPLPAIPDLLPVGKRLPFRVMFDDRLLWLRVADWCGPPIELTRPPSGRLSLMSGQWPLQLHSIMVRGSLHGAEVTGSAVRTLRGHSRYIGYANPMDAFPIRPSDRVAWLNTLIERSAAIGLPLIWAVLFLVLSSSGIGPLRAIGGACGAIAPLLYPSYTLIAEPLLTVEFDVLLGLLLMLWWLRLTSPRTIAAGVGNHIGQKSRRRERLIHLAIGLSVLITSLLIVSTVRSSDGHQATLTALILISAATGLFLALSMSWHRFAAAGLVSVLLFVGFFAATERWLGRLPAGMLMPEQPPGEPGELIKVWRHEQSELKNVPIERRSDVLRILCLGGSSTLGHPHRDNEIAYPARLQARITAATNRRVEVLNGGFCGFSSFLILTAFQTDLHRYQPDIVTVNCRFNDSTLMPRWYNSVPQLTDAEAWRRFERLARIPLIYDAQSRLNRLMLYRYLKGGLLLAASKRGGQDGNGMKKPPPRGTPHELEQHLVQLIRETKRHRARLLIIPEPNIYNSSLDTLGKTNPYIERMIAVAESHGVPWIDVITPIAEHSHEYLYIDYIHPSYRGHELIADAIFDKLIGLDWL